MNDEDDEIYEDGHRTCLRCEGEGVILVCIDDICRGIGDCIHGDGHKTCPNCKGKGEIE